MDRVLLGLGATEADLIAGERSDSYQEQLAKLRDLFADPPLWEAYEVSV